MRTRQHDMNLPSSLIVLSHLPHMPDRGTRRWIKKNHQSLQHRRTSNWFVVSRCAEQLRPCRAPHKAGAFSPSALAMQHNCIRRYLFVMTPLPMYDTLSSNSTSAAEGGRRKNAGGMHHVHREHHSGACPLAPPHKHTRCHTRGHQRNAQHEANGTTRQPNDALPDATHAPLMMIRRHWTNKSYKKQSCLW